MNSVLQESESWLSEFDNGGLAYLTPSERAELDALTATAVAPPQKPDLIAWAATHLRHRLGTYDPGSLTLGLSAFHRDTAARLDELVTLRGQKDVTLAPRGNAKSTWRTIIYPLREALENREPYTLILSDTADTSKKLFRNIREELEGNESLLRAYPHAAGRGPVWNVDEIKLRNGAVIEAGATGKAIRGALRKTRPTLILFDDLQNLDDIGSATSRAHAWEWFTRTVLPLGEPRTNFVGSDTALHREAVSYKLATGGGEWNSKIYKALIEWPENLELWDRWEMVLNRQEPGAKETAREFYLANQEAMDKGAVVLWPERFPLYDLMTKMATMGQSAFEYEEQNNPIDPDSCEWPAVYLDEGARPELRWDTVPETEDGWPAGLTLRAAALDPSKGKKNEAGDYAAIVLFGSDGKYEYIEADLFRGTAETTTDRIIERVVHHCRTFKPTVFGFEAVLFQALYGKLLQQALDAAGLTDVVLVPLEDNTDKYLRIKRLTNPIVRKWLRFRRTKGTQILLDQLRAFGPAADKVDGPDALEMVRRVAWRWTNGKVRRRRGGGAGPGGYTT